MYSEGSVLRSAAAPRDDRPGAGGIRGIRLDTRREVRHFPMHRMRDGMTELTSPLRALIPREPQSVSLKGAAIASDTVALPREVPVAKSRSRLGACPTAGCCPPDPEIGPPTS